MGSGIIHLAEFPEDALAIISLDDPTIKVGPKTFRKRILRWGRWSHPNAPGGVLDVNPAMGAVLVANFSAGVWDHVAVTKGHPKDEADALDKAAGHVLSLDVVNSGTADDGVYAIFQANDETAPKIGNEIKGCSGGIIPNYVDHELGGKGAVGPVLGHLALTNEPYIKDLGPFETAHLANKQRALLLSERTELPEDVAVTKEELIAKAKELGIDPKELATALGLDVAKLEADAAKAVELETKTTSLEAELEKLKKGDIPPVPEPPKVDPAVQAASDAARDELVAALGEALVGQKLIELAEGEKPTLASVVGAIAKAVQGGNAAGVTLAEQQFETKFRLAQSEGRATKAQKDGLKKAWVELGEETFDALTAHKIVELGEFGTQDDIDLSDPPGGGIDTAKEIDRYAELTKSLG